MVTYYTSNDSSMGFDVTTAGAMPADWTAAIGTWAVGTAAPTGSHTHSFGSTSQSALDVALCIGMNGGSGVADMEVTASTKVANWSSGGPWPLLGVILRADAGFSNAYVFLLSRNTASGPPGAPYWSLFNRLGGSYTKLSEAYTTRQSFSNGDTLLYRVRVQGSTLSAKAWKQGNAEPGRVRRAVQFAG